jgi:hypothetical protein
VRKFQGADLSTPNGWSWHRLRQQGFLTLAIVLASAVLVSLLLPHMSFREALVFIAILALALGWVP